MSAGTTRERSAAPLIPPEERFWQRYSPRHEFPLSTVASILVHAVVFGSVALAGYLMTLRWESDAPRPPSMDVVMLEGDGTGLEGFGGGGVPGLPGAPVPGRTEIGGGDPDEPMAKDSLVPPPKLPAAPSFDLTLDPATSGVEADPALAEQLAKLAEAADAKVKEAMRIASEPKELPGVRTGKKGTGGTGTPGGEGGRGGKGPIGPGRGSGVGAGTGSGGFGRKATRQEILAFRWRFDFQEALGKAHAEKLAAIGMVVGFQDPRGQFLIIRDLKERPARFRAENPAKYRDAVKWYSASPQSVAALAQELGMPFAPQFFVLLLPRDREEKLAAAERAYAESQGRDPRRIRATWFDFVPSGSGFEPVVLRQE